MMKQIVRHGAASLDPTMQSSSRSRDPYTGRSTPSKTRPKAER
jgi:hypothetical protein